MLGGWEPVQPLAANGFEQGTVAMVIWGPGIATSFIQAGVDFTIGRLPYPTDGRNGTWGGGDLYVVPHNAKNSEAAIEFVSQLATVESQLTLFRASQVEGVLLPPANLDALAMSLAELPPQFEVLFAQAPELNPRAPLWQAFLASLGAAERAVVEGEKTPHQALDDAQQTMTHRFEEAFGE